MAYYAEWSVFIDGDDLDLIEVARRAEQWSKNPDHGMWRIVDLAANTSTVVDIGERTGPRIISPRKPAKDSQPVVGVK